MNPFCFNRAISMHQANEKVVEFLKYLEGVHGQSS